MSETKDKIKDSKGSSSDLIRFHFQADKDDLSKLRLYFGKTIGISHAIRIAIRRFIRDHETKKRDNDKVPL